MLARPAPDLVEQFARAPIDIFALQKLFIRADAATLTSFAAKRIAVAVWIVLSKRLALLTTLLVLLLSHLLGKFAHAFAQGLHRLRLAVERTGEILIPERVFSVIHCIACPAQRFPRGIPVGRPRAG